MQTHVLQCSLKPKMPDMLETWKWTPFFLGIASDISSDRIPWIFSEPNRSIVRGSQKTGTDLSAARDERSQKFEESVITSRFFFSLLKRFFLLSVRSAQCPAGRLTLSICFLLKSKVDWRSQFPMKIQCTLWETFTKNDGKSPFIHG